MSGESGADVLLVASRLLWYGGLLGVIGAAAFPFFILPADPRGEPHLDRATATTGLAAAIVLLTGVFARLYAQAYVSFGLEEPLTAALVWVIATDLPPWSTGWTVQAAAAVVSLTAFGVARTGSRAGRILVVLAAIAVSASAPLTGHAVSQPGWYALPIALQAMHVLAAGVWIGGLLVMLIVGLSRRARPRAPDPPPIPSLVDAFSPLALVGAGLLAVTGAVTTVLYLHTLTDLWTTGYGRTLLAKLALVGSLAAAGFVNWRYVRPRLSDPAADGLLRRMVGLELLLALGVLALTAVLVGLPQPGD